MIKLYSPDNESELALIKSLFEPEEINYYVLNDHFGTMKIGPKIELLNMKTIYVSEEDFDFAKEIVFDFLVNTKNGSEPFKSQYSMSDKIRMVIETVVFSWFIPGKRWSRNKMKEEA